MHLGRMDSSFNTEFKSCKKTNLDRSSSEGIISQISLNILNFFI